MDNAIKFTPAEGRVQIQVRIWQTDPGFLLVEVVDTGCGISADKTELIFERLFQVSDASQAGRQGCDSGFIYARS